MTQPARKRIGFFASHNGSAMRAVVNAARKGFFPADPVVLISNNADCTAMKWARDQQIPCLHISATKAGSEAAADKAIAAKLQELEVELVVLAGYMRKLGPKVLAAYKNRILNVHPALLPKFGGPGMYGNRVHEAVLAAKETKSGVTIHLVDEIYDHGPIVAQAEVPVSREDDAGTLADRIQSEERLLYPETLRRIIFGEIDLDKLTAPQ